MNTPRTKLWLLLVVVMAIGLAMVTSDGANLLGPEAKALMFLQREVPAWKQHNGCFSCHNNGDAARALYAALRRGVRVPAEVLAETTALSLPKSLRETEVDKLDHQ